MLERSWQCGRRARADWESAAHTLGLRRPAPHAPRNRAGALLGAWVALLLGVAGVAPLAAHDIAAEVKVQTYIKPEGQVLRLIVRTPLKALRDIEYPMNGAYLDLAKADPFLRDAAVTWLANAIEVYEDGRKLPKGEVKAVMATLESDRSYVSYGDALEHVTGPRLSDDVTLPAEQAMLDTLIEYPISSEDAQFAIYPHVERLGLSTLTVLYFLPPQGTVRAFEYLGDAGLIRLDPSWHQAALRFIELGFFHILDGTDHLLFLLCLVIPFRRFRQLIVVVTAFTVAHSITLIGSAMGAAPSALWFPPLIEVGIAASIVYMALENIVGASNLHRRWVLTFGFGLVHGFGFSFVLHETLQFAGSHLLLSLLSFNVGVEIGQMAVLAVLVPALSLLFRYVVAERMGTILLSAFVAHTAWHWMTERWATFRMYPLTWPAMDAGTVAAALRWAMIGVALAAIAWIASLFRRRRAVDAAPETPQSD